MADLILLDIHDFDVILGMDLLSRHHATKDCYRKEVRGGPLGFMRLIRVGILHSETTLARHYSLYGLCHEACITLCHMSHSFEHIELDFILLHSQF